MSLSYEQLTEAVDGGAVALRRRVRLQPAAGVGTKVFPPTYSVDDRAETRYATEKRIVDGETVDAVLLDSVAAQANHLEEALERAWEYGDLRLPVAFVDFQDTEISDLDRITVLEAPHRLADAIFRDALYDDTLFRLSDVGIAVTEARPDDAAAMLRYCPSALLFGMWDSTGPKGGLGSKFQRALVSEIVGVDVVPGTKVGGRIDPLAIETSAGPVFNHADPGQEWTLDPDQAEMKGKKPKPFDRSEGAGRAGNPSKINHGNVAPSIDARSGGVTMGHAEQTAVLSLAALRKLRFPRDGDGQPIPRDRRRAAETAARAAVAALGVAALAEQQDGDYDLRSRCLLIPDGPATSELVSRDGSTTSVELDVTSSRSLVDEAAAALNEHGLGWFDDEFRLVPARKLVALVSKSRDAARKADA